MTTGGVQELEQLDGAGDSLRGRNILPRAGVALEGLLLENWGARLRGRAWQALFLLVAVLAAGFLSYKAASNQITETNLLREDRVSLAAYLDGTAARPFAHRVMTPLLVNAALDLGVPGLLRALPGPVGAKLPQWCAGATSVPAPTCDMVAAYFAVAAGYFFGFLLLIYATCLRLFGGNPLAALAGLGLAFLAVNGVLLQNDLSHIYDFGNLMFVTLLLLCLERRWNVAFTALLPLAFLTKETLFLYSGAFFLANLGRMPFARNLGLFAIQVLSFVVLHTAVRMYFAGNAGEGHEYYLPDQIHFFTEQITVSTLLLLTTALLLAFYRFGEKSIALRRACIVMVPWFALFMVGGEKKELRVIFEILPLLLLLTTDTLVRLVCRDAAFGRGELAR